MYDRNYIDDIGIDDIQSVYGESAFGTGAFGVNVAQIPTCPTGLKYSGDTVTLKATPKDGVGPYYVVFRKDGTNIDPARLGGLYNPILNAPENIEITRIYTLSDIDISGTLSGLIDFSVFISDSCPTSSNTCESHCIINIGCIAPVCNFTVT